MSPDMSQDIRRELIRRNLGIRPINHGQVYTFQIALPAADQQHIPLERYQAIEASLLQHQSNLVSLVIRRTEAYDNEDIEYEVVYGADWLQVAQALNIEMLWAWVFDMSDEQAQSTKAEMAQLLGAANSLVEVVEEVQPSSTGDASAPLAAAELEPLIDRKLQLTADSIKQVLSSSLEQFKGTFDQKLKAVHYRLDTLGDSLSELPELIHQLEQLRQQFTVMPRRAVPTFDGPPIDLQSASHREIETALQQVGAQNQQIQAALAAIDYWKQPGRALTWENLQKSAREKSPDKIKGFAAATFAKLRAIGEIPEA